MTILTNTLVKIIRETLNTHRQKDFITSFYLFGSIIVNNSPNDIDILLIYNGDIHNVKNRQILFNIKTMIRNRVKELTSYDVDYVILSIDEYYSMKDYKNLHKILLYKD